jgi:putative ABC transport system permease protein
MRTPGGGRVRRSQPARGGRVRSGYALARLLIRAAALHVPRPARAAWLREWRSELWHEAHDVRARGASLVRLAWGALPDALARRATFNAGHRGRGRLGAAERTIMLKQELRYGIRGLLRTPGFTAVAVVTLGLALGANAAIFTLVESVLMDPLPYPASDRLVRVTHPVPAFDAGQDWALSEAGYQHLRASTGELEELGVYSGGALNLATGDGTIRVRSMGATASLLDVLGARAALGRVYDAADDVPGSPAVVVLSHGLWTRAFGADRGIIGRTVRLDGRAFEVIGVLEAGFDLPDQQVDVWLPKKLDPGAQPMNSHYLDAIGRLAPGATISTAQSELARQVGRFTELFPGAYGADFMREFGFGVRVADLRGEVVGGIRSTLWILLGAVAVVLVIACANVVNLFLVRIESRGREVAVRSALGASRLDLAAFFLTETLAVALLAGAAGLTLAYAATGMLVALAPASIPRLANVSLGTSTIVFTTVLALLVGLVLGAFPLLRYARGGPARELVGARGSTAGRARHAIQGGLVVAQVALALVLLTSAGLLVRSFQQLRAVDPGFDGSGLLTLDIVLPFSTYGQPDAAADYHRRLLTDVRALPGVASASGTTHLPLAAGRICVATFTESGAGRPEGTEGAPCLTTHQVSADYFATMRIPLVEGRGIEARDEELRTDAAVIARSLAQELWPGESALGKRLRPYDWGGSESAPWHTIVGVADDVHHEGLDRPAAGIVYYQINAMEGETTWNAARSLTLVVRSRGGDPLALTVPIRGIVAAIERDVAVANVRTMDRVVADSTARASLAMMLLGIAAGLALVLGAVGLYGVISYVVGQRRREMGIRMAVGARAGDVSRIVLGRSVRLTLLGIGLGSAAALAVTRVLRSLLYETSTNDPFTLAAVSVILLGVALLASYLPARRAARVDPVEALRAE